MRLGFIGYWQILFILSVVLGSTVDVSKSQASNGVIQNVPIQSAFKNTDKINQDTKTKLGTPAPKSSTIAQLPVVPEAIVLVKNFEGFRSYSYIDSSGLPVIGYGQTRVNGKTVRLGQYITSSQADVALEQELYRIQQLILAQVKVDLTPYQLGALTSLVYNAGAIIVKNSTLIRKLNAGDYVGAAREFPRWNKANQGGELVVYPGLTKRRLAEQKLFLTPYEQIASRN